MDEGFTEGADREAYFRHFEFGGLPSEFRQQKAWKNCGRPLFGEDDFNRTFLVERLSGVGVVR